MLGPVWHLPAAPRWQRARIADHQGYSLPLEGVFFNEFVVQCPLPPTHINDGLLARGILGGLDVSSQVPNGLLLCVTELTTREQIEALVAALGEMSG